MQIIYKYIVCILLFTCLGFTQDTLITKQGKQYIGKVIDSDSKSVEFSYSGWDSPKRFYLNGVEVFLGPKIPKKELKKQKYLSFSIKDRAIYDAKRKARKWVMFPTLAGVTSLSFIIGADYGILIAGTLTILSFPLRNDKYSETQLIPHYYNDSEKEIYHSVYKKTFKRKKLLYSAIGIPVAGSFGLILVLAAFASLSGPDLPSF